MRTLPALLLLVVACGPTSTHTDGALPSGAPADTSAVACTGGAFTDACAAVENFSFTSVEQHEIGLGPDGPVFGSWGVHFQNGGFVYFHSDVTESGTYTCSGTTVTGQGTGLTFTGTFDPTCSALTWDGAQYVRVPAT